MTNDIKQMDLAQLILAKKGDRSYGRLSKDCGGIPTDRRLNSMVLRPMNQFPDVATIQGLAIGLGVSITDVLLASARSLGLSVGAGDSGALTIPGAANLPADAQRVIGDMARELLKMQQTVGVRKDFTEYQAQLRQDFAHCARLRHVPAADIEATLQGPGWYLLDGDGDTATAVDAALGWLKGDNARQIRAALSDALATGVEVTQDDVELAADKGDSGIDPEAVEHTA